MKVLVETHNVDRSEALNEVLETKSQKLQKFLKEDDELRWSFNKNHTDYEVHLEVWKNGKAFNFKEENEDLYHAADDLVRIASRSLSEDKNKVEGRRHGKE